MDWPISRHVERQAQRMHDMMQRQGVNDAKLARLRGGAAYAEGRARCLNCTSVRECLLWLDAKPESAEEAHFCPNLKLFHACKN